MSNILGVFGLSLRTREIDLEEVFREFGTIEKVTIVYDHRVSCIYIKNIDKITDIIGYRATDPEALVLFTLKINLKLLVHAML